MKRLILLGGGHAHVAVLRHFGMNPRPDVELVLVSPGPEAGYSGMLPGLVAGHYPHAACHIDLEHLARFAGARFVRGAARRIDAAARAVDLEDSRLDADVLSVDIGASPATDAVPGATRWADPVKPFDRFLARWQALRAQLESGGGSARVIVVGGGAAGVEILLAMQYRLRAIPHPPVFTLVSARPELLPGHAPAVARIFQRILRRRGVAVEAGQSVAAVHEGSVTLADGRAVAADHVIWATGVSAPTWLAGSGLALDRAGFIEVSPTLESSSHPCIFAAGDIAGVSAHPRPKAGVYAVRQGPALAANLDRVLRDQPALPFVPQRIALALISTGDRHAVATRGRFTVEGDWVWRWKDWIDRRFVDGYNGLG